MANHDERGEARWKPGDRLTHRFNPELGPGRVVGVEGRTVMVEFPGAGRTLRLAAASDALAPLHLAPGRRVRLLPTGERGTIDDVLSDGRVRLAGGRTVAADEVWPSDLDEGLLERLADLDLDPVEDFANRLDALHLAALREASGLGSFLGGRIRLFPHQLHAAERATATDPVRWLLADEVGLGKTVEACLVLNHLARTGRAERCLVVAPETLTVQWLGELWRKHHQVFVLLDEQRLLDVARDFGRGFNPFDVHRRVVLGLETLVARPQLAEQAVAAAVDLLVVDEAHHLRRPPGHPGEPAYRAVAKMAALGRHVLLLTATPLEDDAHGFFRLLQLLRPLELPEDQGFEERLARREPLPPCTSSTRREDIGGLPPRVGVAVEVDDASGWGLRLELEAACRRAAPGMGAPADKAERVRRGLASGAALLAVLGTDEGELRALAREADARDPRVRWLAEQARAWKEAGEKTLVFAAHRETLELLRAELSSRAQLATGVFHEDLSPARRDIEVAQFRQPGGPSLLVSTECGGEGRNFEFCHRLVLFDLPWNPVVVEQRIGRLDRIGRRIPVEIVYFRPPGGIGRDVVTAFESIGLFREPLAGLEPELVHVEAALKQAAVRSGTGIAPDRLAELSGEAGAARARIREAAYHELHRDPYRPEMAQAILARVPGELDGSNQEVVVTAAERLGFRVERQRGRRAFSVEFGAEAIVDHLPGVRGGASFLGTFDREEAVEDEALDYFASGHPLVEGILAELEESPRGRVALLHVEIGAERGLGLLALYKEGPVFEAVAFDAAGRRRPDWSSALRRPPLRTKRRSLDPSRREELRELVRRLGPLLPAERRVLAVAALVVGP